MFFWLASTFLLHAQTNTDSSGCVTNANLLTPFTVTNSAGEVFTNAVAVKLMPNKLIYSTPNGAMGTLRLDALPTDLQERFGYDPSKAAAADEIDGQKKTAQLQHDRRVAIALQQKADYERMAKIVMAGCRTIDGIVVQKIGAGLLVDSTFKHEVSIQRGETRINATKERPFVDEVILLKDYHKYGTAVDDDYVGTIAYPMGDYTYTSVQNASKTIHIYTCDFDKAMNYLLQQQ